ncbi:hypothetical protein BXY70_1943 [Roseovarius halotolerans]|uniref:DUF5343 domain-containing protein n=1 Tax=Roseovarius halotolerans TaxID=505353 RepID=A0A1X6YYE5_9RHOB|nr:DUF5343 domain-containing protein [Roseovarius halotolerans]RKT32595.1 hypothetical protein BXY70_1943 [Roseovarius halotolerans]SLN34969.1 hypothetical protein ROH8110_01762 [Roseovarius halotolerans]
MALASNYYQNLGRLADFFQQIKDAQAPDQLTQKLLKDWGFTSSNDRALIPLLKTLGFLTSDGSPTERYQNFRNQSQSAKVLGEAIREAYKDIFLIKQNPTASDREAIQGKFKSYHNVSDLVANHMTRTFLALLDLADISTPPSSSNFGEVKEASAEIAPEPLQGNSKISGLSGLHYNIQIHLPATKDVEVYNAIFKSLKEHLVD